MLLGQKYTREENKENDLLDNSMQCFSLKNDAQLNEIEEFLRLHSYITPMV